MNFEEKVKSMKVHEIVDAMIQGIRKEHVKLDFATFGEFINGVCYGCGATNAICEINGIPFDAESIRFKITRNKFLGCDMTFLCAFESGVDSLRISLIYDFIVKLKRIGIPIELEDKDVDLWEAYLPLLINDSIENGTLESNLIKYEEFRDWLKEENI